MLTPSAHWPGAYRKSYKAGNRIQVRWSGASGSRVRLKIKERGNWLVNDATCFTMLTSNDGGYDLYLPDLLTYGCARQNLANPAFPEFYIWIETTDGKHVNSNCKNLPLFRMLSETDSVAGFALSAPPAFQFGDDKLGVQIGCKECRVNRVASSPKPSSSAVATDAAFTATCTASIASPTIAASLPMRKHVAE